MPVDRLGEPLTVHDTESVVTVIAVSEMRMSRFQDDYVLAARFLYPTTSRLPCRHNISFPRKFYADVLDICLTEHERLKYQNNKT